MSTATRRGPQKAVQQQHTEQELDAAYEKAEKEAAKDEINFKSLAYILAIFIFGSVAFWIAHTGRISPGLAVGFMVVLTLVTRLTFLR